MPGSRRSTCGSGPAENRWRSSSPIIKPKAYLPVHWDGLSGAFLAGAPGAFSDSTWSAAHDSAHSNQLVQLALAAGNHVLWVAYREDGAKLDRLLIAYDSTFTPSGAGAPATAP